MRVAEEQRQRVREATLLQGKDLFLPNETDIAKTIGRKGGLYTLRQDFRDECETLAVSQNLPSSTVTELERMCRGL